MTVILINLYSHFSEKTSAQNKKCIVYCYLEKNCIFARKKTLIKPYEVLCAR